NEGVASLPVRTSEGGVACVPVSKSVGCVAFLPVSMSEGGMASVPVSKSEGGMASVPVSKSEGGVSFVPVSKSEGGVSSVPVSKSVGGVASVPVSKSVGGVASVLVSQSEGGVSSVPVSKSKGGVSSVPVTKSVGGMSFVPVSQSEGGVSSVPVSKSVGGVASVLVSQSEGGVSSVPVSKSKGGVSSVPVTKSVGGMSFVPVSQSEGGVSSVPVSKSVGGVASVLVSQSEGGVSSVPVSKSKGGVSSVPVSKSVGGMSFVPVSGKGRELADMMERRKVDILCVQETRWKGSKARSIGAGFKLFYYGVDSKRNGVGVVLKEEFVRNVLEVGCELEEKERFWSELDEVMESIPTGERVVIGADFNGHVGEGNTGDEEVMGKFGVKERNLEGQMVVDFAKRMDMAVVNTYFQKREEHRVTYKSGARQHRMVVCRMTLMVCKTKRQKLRQALGGQVVLPDDWETTAEVIRETGRKVLGVSSGRRKEDKETWWWNEEVQDSIQRKRLAKKKWDMDRTEENRQEYKELQRRVKREVSKAKQKAYEELYTRLDTREGEKDLYRLARQRDRDGKDVQQVRVIKDRDGRVLTSEESVQRRWKEYFEELMNEENEREKRVEGVNSVEQKVDKIRKDEVRKALKRMKSGKAVGPDDIPVEVWKCLGEAAVEFLVNLFNRVLENLEKAYDRVPREELWYCMRKSGVAQKYVRVVQDMYERSRTVVRCAVVMDQLSEEVRQESPWTMMFADDIVICSESREQVEENLERWRFALERRGMKRHKVDLFYKLRHVMNELIDLRRQILSGHLTQDQVREVKRHVTIRLDWGNEHLGLDLVPRKDFEMVDADKISVSDLYKMHLSSRHSVQQSTSQGDSMRQRHGDPCRVPVPHHLFVNLKSFTYNTIGEDTDIFFSLYDLREGKHISEKFMVRLNKNGGPKNPEKIDRLCALFTDLSNKDMKRDLYIIAQVIRTGRMLLNDSKKGPPHVHYRRPYGCAVLAMSDVLHTILELKEEKDFVLKVYTCNNENEWYQIHENIIRKSSTKYTAPSTNYGLIISLQLLRGETEKIRRENPMIFNRGVAITRKLGFPDVIMPGDIRNDLYLTLERGDFERGGKSVQKNIEVTVYVLYADGEILKDCISLGSGEPNISEHRSLVLYHNNSPRWSEVIKLPIPIDRFRGSHLRFEFRHCSTKDKGEKKLFGFAFTPLMREDGTTLSDECHELYVYKCDENTTFSNHALYLGLPCCKDDFNGCPNIPSSLIFQRSTKETLWMSTQLSSTKLTQNVDLLALLKWKAQPDRVMDILGRLKHVSGEEIVKFLQDILDTLFSILDDNTDKYGPLVFQSLVFIINLLRDSKYYHFRPVMDTYIQKHFAGALAYKELIRCLKWYMDRSAEVVRQDHIQEAMRALEYLFKFIVQSRILYSRATCGMEEEQFRTSIQELFQSIRFVLSLDSRSSETLIFTQAALLNSFPAIFDELLQMFTVQEVAEFVRGTLGSMPSTVHIGQSMDVVKLQSIARTVDSRLFSFPESRRILLPVVLHHIHLHLRQQKELLICSGILSSIFSIIKASSLETSVQEEVEMVVESLLDVLLQTLLAIMSKSQAQEAVRGQRCPQCTAEITGEYVSCLLSLLRQMTDIHFQHLLDNFQSKEELKEFLLKIFCVFRNLMKLSIFPRDWNVMRLLTSNIIVTTVQYLSPALHKNFTDADFDFKVWNSYFSLAVLYINQPSLQLETLTPSKRKKILDKYGDMRVMMAYELFSMWQNLGENKIHFIPGMIGPFLGVTLVPQSEVRNIMIPIFHDMMDWEQRKNGNFKQVEAELIDKLDSLVSEGKGDENYRELFGLLQSVRVKAEFKKTDMTVLHSDMFSVAFNQINKLTVFDFVLRDCSTQLFGPYPSLLEKIEQETWRETGISFVTSVTRLMERLLDYRDCMKGDETENKKIGCTVNLLNFYKSEINKEEMYIRYIHKLCDMHLQAENYTEAAFTLLLYWELLQWEDRPLREFLHYPAQSEWHRKEDLCRKVIHYFNKGKLGCELEEKERFWSALDEVMESIPTGERVVIGADFNGHVGEGNTGDEEVMGKFGVKERNLEGEMVVEFDKRMDMGVVNTYFQKREEHRVTYKSGEEEVKKIEKKTKWWKLKKEECCEEFRQKLRQALGGQVVLPDDWETTAEVIRETGRKVLGVSSGRRKEDKETWWWNEEVQDSIQRKRLTKKKWDMDRTEENRQEYKESQRRVKREVSKAKQKAYDELYARLDTREGQKDLFQGDKVDEPYNEGMGKSSGS
ncbi:hypothetical protein QTP86_013795, partial [Hemibagrus guttatus]